MCKIVKVCVQVYVQMFTLSHCHSGKAAKKQHQVADNGEEGVQCVAKAKKMNPGLILYYSKIVFGHFYI